MYFYKAVEVVVIGVFFFVWVGRFGLSYGGGGGNVRGRGWSRV